MPYVKCISIHTTVDKSLNYILNPDKTEDRILTASMNCMTDPNNAYLDMKMVYEQFSGEKFNEPVPEKGKAKVKALHYIQSFSAEDNVSPELAHRMAKAFARKTFGDDAQFVIATHCDKDHVHSHILLNTYSITGKKFNSNKTTLAHVREYSDRVCLAFGIKPIMKNVKGKGISYTEWQHKRNGTSWKERIRNHIDALIRSSKNLSELLLALERLGYIVKRGKYISVKAPGQQRAVRLKTLGTDYAESALEQRIADYLASLPKIRTLDEIIIMVINEFRQQTVRLGFTQSTKDTTAVLAEQLKLINSEHISSIGEAEGLLERTKREIAKLENRLNDITAELNDKKLIVKAAERYFKKYGFGEKRTEYSKQQEHEDKLLLKNIGIKNVSDIEGYTDIIADGEKEILELQEKLENLKNKAETCHSIIDNYGKNHTDYISGLIKAAKEKLSEQEQAIISKAKSQEFSVYLKNIKQTYTFSDADSTPNIDDYNFLASGNLLDNVDISADAPLLEKLENIYECYKLNVGDVINVGNKGYYVDRQGYKIIKNFAVPRSEQIQPEQETKKTVSNRKNKLI